MHFATSIAALIGALLGTAACSNYSQSSACDADPLGKACPTLAVTVDRPELPNKSLYIDIGGTLVIHVTKLSGKSGIKLDLNQDATNIDLPLADLFYYGKDGKVIPVPNTAEGISKAITDYKSANPGDVQLEQLKLSAVLALTSDKLTSLTGTVATVRVRVTEIDTSRTAVSEAMSIKSRFVFAKTLPLALDEAPTVLSSGYYPYFRKIGYVGSDLYALQKKPNSPIEQMFRYQFAGASFANSMLTGELSMPVAIPLADIAASRLFLLSNNRTSDLQFIYCPGEPVDLSKPPCVVLDSGPVPGAPSNLLPISTTTALAVSPDTTWTAVGVKGEVYTAPLPMSGKLNWQVIAENPRPAAPPVLQLAVAPLMGNIPSVVVVRAGDTRVYSLSAANTWTVEPGATASLSAAVAGAPIDALALADVDGDGLTDAVMVQGTRVVLSANLGGGRFSFGKSISLFSMPGETIVASAVTIGQVDGISGNDVVVAYTTNNKTNSTYVRRLAVFLNPNPQ